MEGSKKKRAIDQRLEELKKKFGSTTKKEDSDESSGSEEHHHHYGQHSRKKSSTSKAGGPFKASPVIASNIKALMALVNNLYVGNLAPEVTEEVLARIYCRYGELEQIKVMQPRNEEERKRKRNCAFIKFYKYESAYLAKEELGEKFLFG